MCTSINTEICNLATDFTFLLLLINLQVKKKVDDSDVSWNRAMDEVRAQRLIDDYGKNALFVIIDKWPKMKKYQRKPELLPSLEYLVIYRDPIVITNSKKEQSHLLAQLDSWYDNNTLTENFMAAN